MGKKSKSFGNIKKLQLKKTIKGKFEGGQGKYLVRNKWIWSINKYHIFQLEVTNLKFLVQNNTFDIFDIFKKLYLKTGIKSNHEGGQGQILKNFSTWWHYFQKVSFLREFSKVRKRPKTFNSWKVPFIKPFDFETLKNCTFYSNFG